VESAAVKEKRLLMLLNHLRRRFIERILVLMPVALVSARREMEPFSSLTLPMATYRQSLEVAVEESFLLLVFVANSAV
jgi:hypothetical protein